MSWLVKFFQSSLGNKILMSLTGLFLCTFLIVHCAGNCLLFMQDDGQMFNFYADFMSHNPVVSFIAYGLYAAILLHAIKGILIAIYNRQARGGQGYAVKTNANATWYSKNMALLGSWIFVFIGLHMYHFWWKVKMGTVPMISYEGEEVENLYAEVAAAFQIPWISIFYILSVVVLSFHLLHGFQSAFQSLGFNHRKYTPAIKAIGFGLFAVLIPLLFAAMPIYFLLVANG